MSGENPCVHSICSWHPQTYQENLGGHGKALDPVTLCVFELILFA